MPKRLDEVNEMVYVVVEEHDNGLGMGYQQVWEVVTEFETYKQATDRIDDICSRQSPRGPTEVLAFYKAEKLEYESPEEVVEALRETRRLEMEEFKRKREADEEIAERKLLAELQSKYNGDI